jgi:hypothetical protein
MQIDFILEHSDFLQLQNHGLKWNLHYNKQIYPIVLHPFVPFIIVDTEGHNCLCGHNTAPFKEIKQLCCVCECPTLESGYLKAKYRHQKACMINKLACLMG